VVTAVPRRALGFALHDLNASQSPAEGGRNHVALRDKERF